MIIAERGHPNLPNTTHRTDVRFCWGPSLVAVLHTKLIPTLLHLGFTVIICPQTIQTELIENNNSCKCDGGYYKVRQLLLANVLYEALIRYLNSIAGEKKDFLLDLYIFNSLERENVSDVKNFQPLRVLIRT